MNVSRAATAAILGLFIALFSFGEAEALRCGSELVNKGDIRIEVRAKCGEPADVTVYYEEREFGRVTQIVPIEVWIYNFGPQNFIHFLRFENGRLKEIKTGGYGY